MSKHAGGRPTKYTDNMPAKVLECLKQGMSKIEICLELDICMDTLLEYEREHPQFSEAIKKGLMYSQAWWEKKGRDNLENSSFSYTGWYMNMKNRFGWKDKQEVDQHVKLDVNSITEEDFKDMLKEAVKELGQ